MTNFEHDRHRATPVGLRPEIDISKWVWLTPVIVLLVAILPLPYGYYMGMRWVVAGAAVFFAWKEYELNSRTANSLTWIFGVMALVFNPIIPIHLVKLVWIVINLIAAATFWGHHRLCLLNS